MDIKVNEDQAIQDVNAWMDAKKVSPIKREGENYKDVIEALVNAVMYGRLSFDPEKQQLTQHLEYPLELKDSQGKVTTIDALVYKNRISEDSVTNRLKGVKDPDTLTYMRAYVAAATAQPMSVIGRLDTEDASISRTVGSFFM